MTLHHLRPIEIKFAPGKAGTIEGYASTFGGDPDRHGDVVQRGAFAASLASGNVPLMLWSHDLSEPIGVWTELREDATGLHVKGKLILETRRGAEAYELLKADALSGLSIGFRLSAFEPLPNGGRLLTEIDLAEISLVTLPSAARARVTSVKSADLSPKILESILRDAGVPKALAAGVITKGWRGATDNRREAGSVRIKSITDNLNAATAALKGSRAMNIHRKLETKEAPDGDSLDDLQKAIEAHATATAATIAKLTDDLAGTKAALTELEQRSVDGITTMPGARSDLADTLVKNDLVAALAGKTRRDGGQIAVKAADLIGLETKNTVTNNDGDFHSVSPSGLFGGLERRRFIYDALPRVAVATDHVATTREVTYTNAAAVTVAGSPAVYTEGAPKAESDITFETVDLRLPVIAHFLKASNQALSDVGQLRALLDSRLRYGLRVRQDAEIVSTLTTLGNHTAFTPTSGDDAIASVNRALAALEASDAQGTLLCLNPATWRSVQRIRAVAGDGQHIVGNPQQVTGEMLWGVPVLVSNSMTAGKLLALDTATLGEYYVRQDAVIDVGFVNDDFTRNLVTIRAELRGALQVVRAVSVVYGSLTL